MLDVLEMNLYSVWLKYSFMYYGLTSYVCMYVSLCWYYVSDC